MCEKDEVRAAEREFAKKLREENLRLKSQIAEREARDAEYFADIEVRKGKVIFGEKKIKPFGMLAHPERLNGDMI